MTTAADRILVINAGSSSVKFAVFDGQTAHCTGMVGRIGAQAELSLDAPPKPVAAPDHATAIGCILQALEARDLGLAGFRAVAHRVVHGGGRLVAPVRINPDAVAGIEAAGALAPLHNPHNLAAIRAIAARSPGMVQTASFDTAFHATNTALVTRMALPDRPETDGLRRYGFHGLSYASLVQSLPALSGAALPRRLLAFHLGNGASACAIRDGASVATTMGYSPLDGLVMGTRAGALDPEAVLTLAGRMGVDAARALLNHEAGLKALAGQSDMRALLADGGKAAQFAIAFFALSAARAGAGLIPVMGGIDAIAFTGGIGEHAAEVRAQIVAHLDWLGARLDPQANAGHGPDLTAPASRIGLWVVPAREEAQIAAEARALLGV